jgi:glutamyl-tRNA reductase
MESLNVVPVIQHLQEKAEAVRQKEISRSHKVLESLNEEQQKALDVLTRSIVQKILHDPIVFLKKGAQEKDSEMMLGAACLLFGIDSLEDTQRQQDKGLSGANQDKTIL